MILTFGKFAGRTIGEAECADQQYLFWLVAQRRWVKREHPELYKAARNRVVQILGDEMAFERRIQQREGLPTAERFKFLSVPEYLVADLV